MSEKVTGGGGGDCFSHRTKLILWGLCGFVVLVGFAVFLVYIILQPSRPSFILQDVTVYTFNVSTTPPYALTTNMQATLYSKNPNSRIGIEYQSSMDLYASYRGQQVTYASSLPQSYQGHKEIVEWSPFLKGDDVPISPLSGQALAQDMNAGAVMMNIKLDGLVKWKVGGWSSGNYRLYVTCPVNIRFGDMLLNGGFAVSQAVFKGQPVDHCSVETRVGS